MRQFIYTKYTHDEYHQCTLCGHQIYGGKEYLQIHMDNGCNLWTLAQKAVSEIENKKGGPLKPGWWIIDGET
jgi:hypothetical protein